MTAAPSGVGDRALEVLDAVVAGMPGGAARDGQREMVRQVAAALVADQHLLVQAGTGTGKSVGYLVPALARRRRVLVSTATKALQAQLVDKDLPRVAEAVRATTQRTITFAVAKGRRNYLCLERLHGGGEDPEVLDLGIAGGPASRLESQVGRLREWAEETETGDRDEVPFTVEDLAWRAVSVDGRDCLGTKCPFREECFAEKARAVAQDVDVVVANHSLLALDAFTDAQVLPPRDVVVVDEAHELDRFVTEALTAEISGTAVAQAVRLAGPLVRQETKEALDEAQADVESLLARLPTGLVEELPSEARVLLQAFQRTVEGAASQLGSAGGDDEDAEPGESRDLRARNALRELADAAGALLAAGELAAVHVDRSRGASAGRLRVSPLRVDGRLADRLLARTPVVATSATLAVDGGFMHVARQLGFETPPSSAAPEDDDGDEPEQRAWSGVDVGSPFDYRRQAQLYVASDLPEPKDRAAWEAAVDERLVELVRAAGGRTLALFSSRAAAERAAEHARSRLDVPVLLQGEDTAPRLAWRFASDAATCLFATRGFWQGLDVPGSACQLVVIDRLPFTYQEDPLHKARVARAGGGWGGFSLVAVPEAAMALAQGVGRLIRSADDRGVVAVLDPRLASASYRPRLLSGLPPMYPTTDLPQVLASLAAIDRSAPPPLPAGPEPGRRRSAGRQGATRRAEVPALDSACDHCGLVHAGEC
ncbi:MAG TPA: ATP-dependent DNA helicase [Mycobacteriales bacterium]|nr:ATP-dependent DNA helicase [Mycobacteriales bacterium]